jgi:molecular chaperone GrpE (heat shock protein)
MKKKDQELIAEAYNKVLNKQTSEIFNIGDELSKLYVQLGPEIKTKSGAEVAEIVKMIIDELKKTVDEHKLSADSAPGETLQSLLSKLTVD